MSIVKGILRELFLGLISVLLTLIMHKYILGFKSIDNSVYDVPIHDTYIVIKSIDVFIVLVFIVSSLITLIRLTTFDLKNMYVNYSMVIHILIGILLSSYFIALLSSLNTIINRGGGLINQSLNVVFVFQIILTLCLVFLSFSISKRRRK